MSTKSDKQYKYYIAGEYIAILEYDADTDSYLTPTANDSDAILIRYTKSAGSVSTETDTIPGGAHISAAVVDYVRHKLLEPVSIGASERFYNKFVARIRKAINNRQGSEVRVAIPNSQSTLR